MTVNVLSDQSHSVILWFYDLSGRAEQVKAYISAELWSRNMPLMEAFQWLRHMSGSPGCERQLAASCVNVWFCLLIHEAERERCPPFSSAFSCIFLLIEGKRKEFEKGRWENTTFHFLFINLEWAHWMWSKKSNSFWLYFLHPSQPQILI